MVCAYNTERRVRFDLLVGLSTHTLSAVVAAAAAALIYKKTRRRRRRMPPPLLERYVIRNRLSVISWLTILCVLLLATSVYSAP